MAGLLEEAGEEVRLKHHVGLAGGNWSPSDSIGLSLFSITVSNHYLFQHSDYLPSAILVLYSSLPSIMVFY